MRDVKDKVTVQGDPNHHPENTISQRMLLNEAIWQLTDNPIDRLDDLRGQKILVFLHEDGEFATAEKIPDGGGIYVPAGPDESGF